MKKPTVFNVADYFLSCVDHDAGGAMTHLKLQKIVYYAQAWNLVFNHETLFDEEIQAWVHGPVCPELWQRYRDYGWSTIEPNENFNPSVFTDDQLELLSDVWEAYGQFDGKYLEELTHQEKPWIEARKGYSAGEHCTETISLTTMKEFYTQLSNE